MSVIKHKEQRVGIFIDTQNLYHSAKNLYHAKVNFDQVVKDAVGGRQLIRAIAYVITTESGEEKSFFDALTKIGIETKTKDLQIFSSGSKKADWDVGLAIDAVKLAPKLDAVVLVSGDGDFIPLVKYLQENQGCQVEAMTFGKSASMKLKEAVDDFLDLDSDPSRYLMSYRGPRRPERTERAEKPAEKADAPAAPRDAKPGDKPESRMRRVFRKL
ncbi:MAG: NYN domain-containing protein [Candidatus Paceibacterota bacterium]|jgi:uncharacterized LabA/DUF88 family protein